MKRLKDLENFESTEEGKAHPEVVGEHLTKFLQTMAESIDKLEPVSVGPEPIEELDEQTKLPKKTEFRFEISGNLKKVAKIQKNLIDLAQLLAEMSDQIVALKLNSPAINPEDLTIINNLKYNIDNMVSSLRKEKKNGRLTGVIDNSKRMQRNLEHLKKDFLKSRGL